MRQLQSVYCWKPFQLSAFKCAVLFFRDKLLLDTFQCNSNNCEFIDGISLQIHLPNSFFSHLFVPVVCICDVPFCVHTARIKTYTEKRIVIRRLTLHEISQSLILFAPWNRLNLEFHYFVLLQILLEFPDVHIKYINLWDSWWLLYYWRIFGFAVDKRDKTFVSEISLIELNELNAFELRILRKSKAKSSIDNSMLYFVFSCFLSSCVPFAQLISRFVR